MVTRPRRLQAVWYFLAQYPLVYGGLFLVTVAYALLESLNISILFPLLQSAVGQEPAADLPLFAALRRVIAQLPFEDPVVGACVLAVTVLAVKEAVAFGRQALIAFGVGRVVCDVKEAVFRRYLHSDYQFFLDRKQGDLAYTVLLAPGRLGACLRNIPELASAAFMTLALGSLLLALSVPVTLALAVVGLVFNGVTQFLARQLSYHIGKERVVVDAEAHVAVNELVDGIKQITVANALGLWWQRFARPVRRFKELVIRDEIWIAIPERVMQFVPALIMIGAALWIRYSRPASPEIMLSSLPVIGVYGFACYRLLPFLTSFGRLSMQLMGTLPDAERLYELLRASDEPASEGHRVLDGFREAIRFERVGFDAKDRPGILRDVSFSIRKGQHVAIVGPSGAGKSTVAHLLMRLFEPTQGRILVDDIEIKELTRGSLRQAVALVSQETFIFHGTVRDNIAFGHPEATPERLAQAARLANAHEFIERLPQGYDTVIGDKGLKLSGGQRQRLAIARAILRDPAILVLDEATSSLDYQSEALVQQAIAAASKDRTVITIAHRFSTVSGAETVLIMDGGRVVDEGTPESLRQRHSLYRGLAEHEEKAWRRLEPKAA